MPGILTTKFQALMKHPAGPMTVHFWAPVFKWALVIAGLNDLKKPAEELSTAQNAALAVTGVIWARYCTQIIPVNYNLLAVNAFVGLTGIYQLFRKFSAPKPPPVVPVS